MDDPCLRSRTADRNTGGGVAFGIVAQRRHERRVEDQHPGADALAAPGRDEDLTGIPKTARGTPAEVGVIEIEMGAQPPTPEWGAMLANALQFIQRAWWVVTLPGLAILSTVLAFNLAGDGLRDALDPKLKR